MFSSGSEMWRRHETQNCTRKCLQKALSITHGTVHLTVVVAKEAVPHACHFAQRWCLSNSLCWTGTYNHHRLTPITVPHCWQLLLCDRGATGNSQELTRGVVLPVKLRGCDAFLVFDTTGSSNEQDDIPEGPDLAPGQVQGAVGNPASQAWGQTKEVRIPHPCKAADAGDIYRRSRLRPTAPVLLVFGTIQGRGGSITLPGVFAAVISQGPSGSAEGRQRRALRRSERDVSREQRQEGRGGAEQRERPPTGHSSGGRA